MLKGYSLIFTEGKEYHEALKREKEEKRIDRLMQRRAEKLALLRQPHNKYLRKPA